LIALRVLGQCTILHIFVGQLECILVEIVRVRIAFFYAYAPVLIVCLVGGWLLLVACSAPVFVFLLAVGFEAEEEQQPKHE